MNSEEEKELKVKRIKIYLAPLLPIDPKKIDNIDKSQIDINKSQVFLYSEDIYRELAAYILHTKSQQMGRKPTYKLVSLTEVTESHFVNHTTDPMLLYPDILLIVHSTGHLNNPMYGTIFNKIIEERNILNKLTYLFFKGNIQAANTLKITDDKSVVNYYNGTVPRVPLKTSSYTQFNSINTPSVKSKTVEIEPEEEEEKPKRSKGSSRKTYVKYDQKNLQSSSGKEVQEGPIKITDSEKYGGLM